MPYLDIFSHIVAYLETCATLAYSEPCYILNLAYLKLRYIQSSFKANPGIFRMLCNASILRILPYSEFWQI